MPRKTLFQTEYARVTGLDEHCSLIIKYLIDNRSCYLTPGDLRNVYQMRSYIPSAFNAIFDNILDSNKIGTIFAPVRTDVGIVPELLTTNDITLDLKQFPDAHILKSFSEFYGKVLINLSPILRVNKAASEHLSITDMNAMHALYGRAALVASYQDSDGWLTPSLNLFIVKTYSMVISSILAKQYDLTLLEQTPITAAFAIYMCQALAHADDDYAFPVLFNRCTFISSKSSTLEDYAKGMEHLSKTGLTIQKLCQLVVEMGPPRMSGFNPTILYRNISNLGTSPIQMALALEYPPYWVYQILMAVSNTKMRLLFELKGNSLLNDAKAFVHELNTSRSFIDSLHR